MNIFTTIIKDEKTIAAKFEADFKKLFNEAPSWIVIADNFVNFAAPLVTAIATIANPAAGSAVAIAITDLKGYLAMASAAVDVTNRIDAATTLPVLLTNIQSNLPTLLAAIKVENPVLVSKVETDTNLIAGELSALLSALGAPTPATA